jgi:P27 family predicted phage terminase small subunit
MPKNEPVFAQIEPEPPSFLSEFARVEWARICCLLRRAGLMTAADRAALAAYCQAYGRWKQAETELASMTLTVEYKNGAQIQNPLVAIANKAMADVVRFASEFGMTPSARSRVQADPQADGDKAQGIEKYFH